MATVQELIDLLSTLSDEERKLPVQMVHHDSNSGYTEDIVLWNYKVIFAGEEIMPPALIICPKDESSVLLFPGTSAKGLELSK